MNCYYPNNKGLLVDRGVRLDSHSRKNSMIKNVPLPKLSFKLKLEQETRHSFRLILIVSTIKITYCGNLIEN